MITSVLRGVISLFLWIYQIDENSVDPDQLASIEVS